MHAPVPAGAARTGAGPVRWLPPHPHLFLPPGHIRSRRAVCTGANMVESRRKERIGCLGRRLDPHAPRRCEHP